MCVCENLHTHTHLSDAPTTPETCWVTSVCCRSVTSSAPTATTTPRSPTCARATAVTSALTRCALNPSPSSGCQSVWSVMTVSWCWTLAPDPSGGWRVTSNCFLPLEGGQGVMCVRLSFAHYHTATSVGVSVCMLVGGTVHVGRCLFAEVKGMGVFRNVSCFPNHQCHSEVLHIFSVLALQVGSQGVAFLSSWSSSLGVAFLSWSSSLGVMSLPSWSSSQGVAFLPSWSSSLGVAFLPSWSSAQV